MKTDYEIEAKTKFLHLSLVTLLFILGYELIYIFTDIFFYLLLIIFIITTISVIVKDEKMKKVLKKLKSK